MSPLSACGRGPAVEAWERAATAEVLPQRTGNSAPFSSAWIQLNWHPFRDFGKQLEVENKGRKFAQWFPVDSRCTVFSQWERGETIWCANEIRKTGDLSRIALLFVHKLAKTDLANSSKGKKPTKKNNKNILLFNPGWQSLKINCFLSVSRGRRLIVGLVVKQVTVMEDQKSSNVSPGASASSDWPVINSAGVEENR